MKRPSFRAPVVRVVFLGGAILLLAGAVALAAASPAQTRPAGPKYTIKLTDEVPVNAPLSSALAAWKASVERDTHGQVKVDIFPAGQLLSDADAVNAIQQNTIQMNVSTTGRMASIIPSLQIFDFPYLFTSGPQIKYFWQRKAGQLINKRLEAKHVRGLAIWPMTGRIIIATSKKVTSQQDLAGLKIRIYGSAAQATALQALGATGVIVQPSEVATAIATHVVDGIATGITYWWQNFNGPLPYALYTSMWVSPYAIWANNDFWTKLPKSIQTILLNDLDKSEVVGLRQVLQNEKAAVASHHVTFLSKADMAAWRARTKNVAAQYASSVGADVVRAISNPKTR